jgi:hypothetical protein
MGSSMTIVYRPPWIQFCRGRDNFRVDQTRGPKTASNARSKKAHLAINDCSGVSRITAGAFELPSDQELSRVVKKGCQPSSKVWRGGWSATNDSSATISR